MQYDKILTNMNDAENKSLTLKECTDKIVEDYEYKLNVSSNFIIMPDNTAYDAP